MRRLTLITKSRLDLASVCRAVSDPRFGAVTSFMGSVRRVHAGRTVRSVSYDCFAPLAQKVLADIAARPQARWPVRVAAAHRTGRLSVGEVSVIVAAASVHRAEAFEACRFVIEDIKHRLPVWKKEHYATGDGRWLPGCSLRGRRR